MFASLREVIMEFQSTRPRGARRGHHPTRCRRPTVSIHAPTRGATVRHSVTQIPQCVSIHAPTRGATYEAGYKPQIDYVSIHAPTRGATGDWSGLRHQPKFQSTRPRGARLELRVITCTYIVVSIHAPTRGATNIPAEYQALARFQSTRPRGARQALPESRCVVVPVSIHAPTRGATSSNGVPGARMVCFNPRAHAGRDELREVVAAFGALFQSTRPRGARPDRVPPARRLDVSIHAPTRGATS